MSALLWEALGVQRLHVEQRMGELEGFFPVLGKLSAEGWHLGQLVWAKRLLQQNWRGASFLLAVEQTTDKKKKKGSSHLISILCPWGLSGPFRLEQPP